MKGTTYKQTLTGDWDKIVVKDGNNAELFYRSATVIFKNDIILRGKEGEEEIPISSSYSPMNISGDGNNGFPFEIKGNGDIFILANN